MDLLIDAMGDACPLPVVKAKKALGTIDVGTVEVHVDNETAVHNLENLAKAQKCEVRHEDISDAEYHVFITKTEKSAPAENGSEAGAVSGCGPIVVAIGSQFMGSGNDELGATLIKAFIFSLTQQDTLPDTILFYNGGAHLTAQDSPVLDDLKALAGAGVEILTCGTCANFYGLEDKLAVGEVTNMYVIAEIQLKANVVVRP